MGHPLEARGMLGRGVVPYPVPSTKRPEDGWPCPRSRGSHVHLNQGGNHETSRAYTGRTEKDVKTSLSNPDAPCMVYAYIGVV